MARLLTLPTLLTLRRLLLLGLRELKRVPDGNAILSRMAQAVQVSSKYSRYRLGPDREDRGAASECGLGLVNTRLQYNAPARSVLLSKPLVLLTTG